MWRFMLKGGRFSHNLRALSLLLVSAVVWSNAAVSRAQTCGNAIACENALTGNLPTEWDITSSGDSTIQGFATDISVNRGATVAFKITTTAPSYRIDIYRLGYYGGRGARKVASINPSSVRNQPTCLRDPATGLVDCGNWTTSATWSVPSSAVSGVYIARPVRSDTGGASHIMFIVRDDAGHSDMLFQTSDPTWHAYNDYGGASLYAGNGPAIDGRNYKVSYNRPFANRTVIAGNTTPLGFFFTTEYPMIRWLEANGYNVSYAAGLDTDRRGSSALTTHKVFLSVGHDEYWSLGQRTNVEAARGAGVHLAFFSGNEVFWKTRWENSIDGTNTPYRTLACYKETHAGAKIDPTGSWTGTWRDPRFSPPADGGRPENALTGQIFTVNGDRADPMFVSAADGKLRFWRNTGLDTLLDGQHAQFPAGLLGYEWDEALDNGFAPAGLVRMSDTTLRVDGYYLQDYGSTYGAGTATHTLTLYRHSSGALVFGAGTTQWAWGLDATHDYPGMVTDSRVKQATVNLFADMGVQPVSLQSGLTAASASTDTLPPTSLISGLPSLTTPAYTPVTIFGTATDAGGGRPAAVEVSLDGGSTWHPATGAGNWRLTWTPTTPGLVTVRSRAVDDSGRIETPSAGLPLTVTLNSLKFSLWSPSAVPALLENPDAQPVELGVRFQADRSGWVTAIRFYKGAGNTGTHIGNLWKSDGTNLGKVTFTGETTSGWQQATLSSPVALTAGAYYVVSYHTDVGHYSHDVNYFASKGVIAPPLSAPADGLAGGNGLYHYGASAFPTDSAASSNYWVDVVFVGDLTPDTTPPLVLDATPSPGEGNVGTLASVVVRFNEPVSPASISASSFFLKDSQNALVPASVTYDSATQTARLQATAPFKASAAYTATVKGGLLGVSDLAGNKLANDFVWTFRTGAVPVSGYTLWPPETVPLMSDMADNASVEIGVRFGSDRDGWINAVRFYKSAANTGPHVGNIWANDGTLLATVNFTGETASGWQEAKLATAVPITAGKSYVASYHTTTGHYSDDAYYFAGAGVDSSPLSAPADGEKGSNGLYHYGASAFPTDSYAGSNYWVDVAFVPANVTASPTFTPAAGIYATGQSVTISDATPGAQIRYTTDGSDPTALSPLYAAPITVSANTTIKALAMLGSSSSGIAVATYSLQVAPPVFTPGTGTYSTAQSVKLSDAATGAKIYYTTDGTTPTASSPLYSTPFSVNSTTTVNAIAAVTGWTDSTLASATYTISVQGGTVPASPSGLTASAASSSQVNLTWVDASNNESNFKLERKTGASGTYAQIATPPANTTSYSDTSVAASTTYFYRIRATNTTGNSGYSNEASTSTPAATVLPSPWLDRDIGTVGTTGSGLYSNGTFTVKGAGADIWNTADAFNFVYQPMTGNAEIVAKVVSIQNTDGWAKGGVMMRETLSPDSEQALMAVSSANGLAFQRRTSTGGASTHTGGAAVAAPYWVRLVRQGTTFTGYASSDGLSWTQVGSAAISMVPTIYVGLAVTSHNSSVSCTSVFNNVFITTEPAAPSALTATVASGSQINLSWKDNSTNESGFKLERKTGAAGTYAQIVTLAAGVTTYSDNGLAAGTTYYYRVRSSNTGGDSAYSNEASGTTTAASIPIFRAATSAGATSGVLSLKINKPAGTAQGDVLVAAIAIRPSTATVTAPSGWTLLRRINNSSGNSGSLVVYYKVATASEATNYSWSFNASSGSAGGIRGFSNVDTANPIDVDAGQNTGSGLTLPAPSVTTRYANDMIVTSHEFSSAATFTPPNGMTEAFEATSDAAPNSAGVSMEGNYQLQGAIGVTGTRTATANANADTGNAHTLALKAR